MKKYLLSAFLVGVLGYAHEAHVHGSGSLNVVLAGKDLRLEMALPAFDLVGSEEAPKDPVQRRKVENQLEALKMEQNIFAFPAAAECRSKNIKVETELLEANHHSHHGDFDAVYEYSCNNPQALKELTLLTESGSKAFKAFPKIGKLVGVVSSEKQISFTLTPKSATLDLTHAKRQ